MKNKKIIFIVTSDWHFRESNPKCRIDNYFETQKEKLEFVKKIQEENNCPIFDCGDLLDKCKVSPFLEGWLIDNLPTAFYTVAGNHDLPNHRIEDLDQSSLGVLIKAKKINHLKYYCQNKDFVIHGFDFGEKKEYEIIKDKKNIAFLHEFISLDKFPGSLTPEGLTEELPGFDFIFCGHNHLNFGDFVNDCQVINVGSMLRMDADQLDYEPCFYVVFNDFSFEKVKFSIKKNVIDRKYIDIKNKTEENLHSFVESLSGKYEIGKNFKENLENFPYDGYNIGVGVKEKIKKALL